MHRLRVLFWIQRQAPGNPQTDFRRVRSRFPVLRRLHFCVQKKQYMRAEALSLQETAFPPSSPLYKKNMHPCIFRVNTARLQDKEEQPQHRFLLIRKCRLTASSETESQAVLFFDTNRFYCMRKAVRANCLHNQQQNMMCREKQHTQTEEQHSCHRQDGGTCALRKELTAHRKHFLPQPDYYFSRHHASSGGHIHRTTQKHFCTAPHQTEFVPSSMRRQQALRCSIPKQKQPVRGHSELRFFCPCDTSFRLRKQARVPQTQKKDPMPEFLQHSGQLRGKNRCDMPQSVQKQATLTKQQTLIKLSERTEIH